MQLIFIYCFCFSIPTRTRCHPFAHYFTVLGTTMPTATEWKETLLQLEDWKGAADYVDDELIALWEAEPQMKLETLHIMLQMSTTSQTARTKLFGNNLMFMATAESLATKLSAPLQKPAQIIANSPSAANKQVSDDQRPRSDYHLGKGFWCDLKHVFFLGQKNHMADSMFLTLPTKEDYSEYRGDIFTYSDLFSYKFPQCNVFKWVCIIFLHILTYFFFCRLRQGQLEERRVAEEWRYW